MTMIYSNPAREQEAGALPDVEVFHHDSCFVRFGMRTECGRAVAEPCGHAGWYWRRIEHDADDPMNPPQVGMSNGPFATEAEAVADAQADTPELICVDCHKAICEACRRCHNCNDDARTEACIARGNPASAPCDTNEEA